MRFVFKLSLLFIALDSYSVVPILITYRSHSTTANKIKQIITNQIGIPKKLIEIQLQKKPCLKNFQRVLHVCIDENNELQLVTRNKEVLNKSFQIFLK